MSKLLDAIAVIRSAKAEDVAELDAKIKQHEDELAGLRFARDLANKLLNPGATPVATATALTKRKGGKKPGESALKLAAWMRDRGRDATPDEMAAGTGLTKLTIAACTTHSPMFESAGDGRWRLVDEAAPPLKKMAPIEVPEEDEPSAPSQIDMGISHVEPEPTIPEAARDLVRSHGAPMTSDELGRFLNRAPEFIDRDLDDCSWFRFDGVAWSLTKEGLRK